MSVAKPKLIEYHGKLMTLMELSAIHGVHHVTINNRLKNGWDIEEAISVPAEKRMKQPLPKEFASGNIVEIVFRQPLGQVRQDMQPILHKPYVATAHPSVHAETCYIINLDIGKPLIVYRNEFEIFRVTPPSTFAMEVS